MAYTICLLDNDIPANAAAEDLNIDDAGLLNTANLKLLLQTTPWPEATVKDLVERLIEDLDETGQKKWSVYGYTNPNLYLGALAQDLFRSDIIIYDWEYPTATPAAEVLKEILDNSFSLVFVFSGADKKQEILDTLNRPEFQEYKERLSFLDKRDQNSDQIDVLIKKAIEMSQSNFSFRFAGDLRKKSLQCIDRILSDIGKASLNDIKNQIITGHTGKKDFIDFLAERFRSTLAEHDLHALVDQVIQGPNSGSHPDNEATKRMWSYRLYFNALAGDDHVRRGDIVEISGEYHFILSADCDLGRFWKKNLGMINTVVLHKLDSSNATLKEWLRYCSNTNKMKESSIESLFGKIQGLPVGPFILPFVPTGGSDYLNFLALPKDLESKKIPVPPNWNDLDKKMREDRSITYQDWAGAKKVCTVSEPFLTPAIQHILNTIGGYGAPDYQDPMQGILKNILNDFASDSTIAPSL